MPHRKSPCELARASVLRDIPEVHCRCRSDGLRYFVNASGVVSQRSVPRGQAVWRVPVPSAMDWRLGLTAQPTPPVFEADVYKAVSIYTSLPVQFWNLYALKDLNVIYVHSGLDQKQAIRDFQQWVWVQKRMADGEVLGLHPKAYRKLPMQLRLEYHKLYNAPIRPTVDASCGVADSPYGPEAFGCLSLLRPGWVVRLGNRVLEVP